MQLLREWDALLSQVAEAHRKLAIDHAAARQLQRAARRQLAWKQVRASAAVRLQCSFRVALARRRRRDAAATRLQCAARQKLARQALEAAYWRYAFGLLESDAASKLQRWRRMCVVRRAARADLQLLRDWDALTVQVREAKARRVAAVIVLQRRVRRFTTERWLRFWSAAGSVDPAVIASMAGGASLDSEENPFSDSFVGAEEHRRRIAAKYGHGGKLKKHGHISVTAMARALPSQLATLCNTLRLVDAVNALLSRRVVEVSSAGEHGERLSAAYDELMAWGGQALQARFAGATQYLKAAKSFGLTADTGCAVTSFSLGLSRRELLDMALRKPHRVVPAMFAGLMEGADANEWSRSVAIERLTRLVYAVEPFRERTREYMHSSFEWELRECQAILEEEFWPSDEDDAASDDEGDQSLKRVADKAAVERVLNAHDHFDVLALPRDCTPTDVKRAFFKLSKTVHPDKNGARRANEAFDALNTAKQTLLDPEERDAYCALHPPRAAVAREWAKGMDGNGKTTWQRGSEQANEQQHHYRNR